MIYLVVTNPIQISLIKITGSYYNANLVLYCLTAICFILHFIFSGNNPITSIKSIIVSTYNKKFKNKS